jgi:hypothetical protein
MPPLRIWIFEFASWTSSSRLGGDFTSPGDAVDIGFKSVRRAKKVVGSDVAEAIDISAFSRGRVVQPRI